MNGTDKLLAALRDGIRDREALMRASGFDESVLRATLTRLKAGGVIAYERAAAPGGPIDMATLRVLRDPKPRARNGTVAKRAAKPAPKRAAKPRAEAPSRAVLVDGLALDRVRSLARQFADEIEALAADARPVPDDVRALVDAPDLVESFVRLADALRRPVTMAAPAAAERRVTRSTSPIEAFAPVAAIAKAEGVRGSDWLDEVVGDNAEANVETTDPIAADDDEPARGDEPAVESAAAAEEPENNDVPEDPAEASRLLAEIQALAPMVASQTMPPTRDGKPFDKALVRALRAVEDAPGCVVVSTRTGVVVTR